MYLSACRPSLPVLCRQPCPSCFRPRPLLSSSWLRLPSISAGHLRKIDRSSEGCRKRASTANPRHTYLWQNAMIAARKLLRTSVANDPPRACDVVYYFGHSSVQVCRLSFTSSRCEAALKDWGSTATERVDSHGEEMASHRVRPVRISDRACATERSLKLRQSIRSPPLLRELGPDTRFVATESNISY